MATLSGGPAEEADERICRYCFEGEAEGELVSPCRCAGGQKWVHLACLRRWQREILAAIPTHPDLISENRQRICNICSSPFTILPPTRMELLVLCAGTKVAELITQGSLIGSHRGFSGLLQQQLAALPLALRSSVAHRHWIRGLFLIVRVFNSTMRTVRLRIDDSEDLQAFARRLEDRWAFEMQGRPLRIVREGPLAATELTEDADASTIRRAVLALRAPVILTLQSAVEPDSGEDGVIAVNLTRRIDLLKPADAHKHATFAAAVRTVLQQRAEEALLPGICHFIGGPCNEDEPVCCILIGGSKESYTVHHSLIIGLCEAQAQAKLAQASGRPPAKPPQLLPDVPAAPDEALMPAPPSLPPAVKRRRGGEDSGRAGCADAAAQPPAEAEGTPEVPPVSQNRETKAGGHADGEAPKARPEAWVSDAQPRVSAPSQGSHSSVAGESVRLLVFWGSAGWSRHQLLGETARGSWGLCRAEPEDIIDGTPERLWGAVYPRLAFAPQSQVSENYAAQDDGSAEEEEDSNSDRSGWQHRWLAQRGLNLQRRARTQGEGGNSNANDSFSDDDSHPGAEGQDGQYSIESNAGSGHSGNEASAATAAQVV